MYLKSDTLIFFFLKEKPIINKMKIKSVGRGCGKKEPLYTMDGNVN